MLYLLLQANVILTEHDLETMGDIFDAGSIAYVISTNNLFIKSLTGWINIPVSYCFGHSSSILNL